MNTPITYTVNTAQTKAETTFRIEACNTVLVSDSLSACHGLFHAECVHNNIIKIPPHIGLYLLFCIASNCQLIRLICRKFWFWAAISHANMQLGLEILKWNSLQTLKVKWWQLNSLHKCWLCKTNSFTGLMFIPRPHSLQGIVRGFKYTKTIQSKALLSHAYLACNIQNEN